MVAGLSLTRTCRCSIRDPPIETQARVGRLAAKPKASLQPEPVQPAADVLRNRAANDRGSRKQQEQAADSPARRRVHLNAPTHLHHDRKLYLPKRKTFS
jgi:hypothetical protein